MAGFGDPVAAPFCTNCAYFWSVQTLLKTGVAYFGFDSPSFTARFRALSELFYLRQVEFNSCLISSCFLASQIPPHAWHRKSFPPSFCRISCQNKCVNLVDSSRDGAAAFPLPDICFQQRPTQHSSALHLYGLACKQEAIQ